MRKLRSASATPSSNRCTATRWHWRETNDGGSAFTDVNYIIPTFILTQLPVGLVGLLIVAIVMAATRYDRG